MKCTNNYSSSRNKFRENEKNKIIFSILNLNCFLIPSLISWNPYLWAPFWSCKRPIERANRIAHLAKNFDLICLQEVWGTNLTDLSNIITSTHHILPETYPSSNLRWLTEIIDPLKINIKETGGLWFAWKKSKFILENFEKIKFDPIGQVPFSKQNVSALYLKTKLGYPEFNLILFATHFSLFSNSRENNLNTLRKFILGELLKVFLNNTSNSKILNFESFELKNTGVLLCGDFNLDPERSPVDYERLISLNGIAKLRDLFSSKENPNYYNQETYFSQESCKLENKSWKGNSLFPWPFKGRIDYIFTIDEIQFNYTDLKELELNDFSKLFFNLDTSGEIYSKKIEFGEIKCLGMDIMKQDFGNEYSDHWPLKAILSFDLSPIQNKLKHVNLSSLEHKEPQEFKEIDINAFEHKDFSFKLDDLKSSNIEKNLNLQEKSPHISNTYQQLVENHNLSPILTHKLEKVSNINSIKLEQKLIPFKKSSVSKTSSNKLPLAAVRAKVLHNARKEKEKQL